jgi:lipoprotein-anchoring transpeptidase ErfK/SrfK
MRKLINGWTMLAGALAGLLVLGGAMIAAEPPQRPEPAVAAAASGAAADAALASGATAPTPVSTPAAAPSAAPSPVDERFVIKRILPITGPIRYGEWHWDDAGVPDGPIVITVDLQARVLSIFKGGYEIGATAVLLGTQEKPTPTGVFPIMQKRRHHVSNIYGAPMPYMQRLTNDGISLHASNVERGYASHGCIGMPEPFAAKVFATTSVGDRVFITDGKRIGMGDSLVGH